MDKTLRQKRIAAMIETGYAYVRRGDAIQYNETELTPVSRYDGGPFRRTDGFSPEDATQDSYRFTVCSSFFYNVLWDAFRYRFCNCELNHLCITAESYYKDYCIYHWEKECGKTVTMAMREALPLLEPGDAIEFSHHNIAGRHIVLVAEDGVLLHSCGLNYNFAEGIENWEYNGGVRKTTIEDFMLHTLGELPILHYDYFNIYRLVDAIDSQQYPLTPQALSRLKYKGLDIDRRCDKRAWQVVRPGETITYTLRLTNHNPWRENHTTTHRDLCGIPVAEVLPEGTELVLSSLTNDADYDGKNLRWTVDIGTEQTVVLQYTVRVKEDMPLGSNIVSTGGCVANIPSNTIVTPVGSGLDAAEWLTLRNLAKDGLPLHAEFAGDGVAAWVYKHMLQREVTLPTLEELLNSRFIRRAYAEKADDPSKVLLDKKDDGVLHPFAVGGMEGGRSLVCVDRYHRILEFRGEHLQGGDIILVCRRLGLSHTETEQYLCLGGNRCIKSASGTAEVISLPAPDSFFACDYFCVLRPAMLGT